MEQQLVLDRYRPLAELGEGAFGTVLLAWDTRMQRRVAIKRIDLPPMATSGKRAPQGLGEARTAAMLSHPNIVTVFDFDTDSDQAFLVMEYVEGASLAEVLDSVGQLEPDETASVFGDVADALAFAHDNGVLHLDIKPENVLLTRDGRAKVADFGIAQLSTLAGHGAAFGGTYGYMPLEQLKGGEVSERTDQWALAVLALESLTGDNPFVPDSPGNGEALLGDLSVVEPSADADVAPAADEVLAVALSPAPTDRYPTVDAFADALLPLLGDAQGGRVSLSEIVTEIAEEGLPAEKPPAALGLWDRASGRAGRRLVGVAAAAQAAWLAWAGLTPLALDARALGAAAALAAVAGLLAPSLGIALGIGCLAFGLAASGSWIAAVAVPLIGGAWWWLFARRSGGAAVLPLAAPALGAIRLPLAQPLICGFALPPVEAAVTALLGGALHFVASAASAQAPPYALVRLSYATDIWSHLPYAAVSDMAIGPAAWVALLGWPVAAAVSSVFSARATRAGALVGAGGGAVVLAGAYMLAERVAVATASTGGYQSPEFAAVLTGSLILVAFVTALGAPVRGEEEGLLGGRERRDSVGHRAGPDGIDDAEDY